MAKTVLFVCRGNAFRSILADAYLKSKQLPDVKVLSAGTVAAQYYEQNGVDFNAHMADYAATHGIGEFIKDHYGDQLTQELLDYSDIAILLNDIVRQEAKQAKLRLPPYTQVWSVVDMGEAGRIAKNREEELQFKEDIYKEICTNVDKLIKSDLT